MASGFLGVQSGLVCGNWGMVDETIDDFPHSASKFKKVGSEVLHGQLCLAVTFPARKRYRLHSDRNKMNEAAKYRGLRPISVISSWSLSLEVRSPAGPAK